MIDRNDWKGDLSSRLKPPPNGKGVLPVTVGDGWKDLICDLVDKLDATGVEWWPYQVKEKFGYLRFDAEISEHPTLESILTFKDFKAVREEARRMIGEAESRSRKICEKCGQSGSQVSFGMLLQTLCGPCGIAADRKRRI